MAEMGTPRGLSASLSRVGEVTKEEIRETRELRSIITIKDKISQLESQGGNEREIWRLHRRAVGMYDLAFLQSEANFDRITDGDLVLLAKRREELMWARDHANDDKDRKWAEKSLERQQMKIDRCRTARSSSRFPRR
jgi:hypothetical protein